jgi:hypothetical protein
MKKLKLRALELGANEMLTREQLKHVLGGDGSSGAGCLSDCSVGVGSIIDGTWKVIHGSCTLQLGGGGVNYCGCSVSGTSITDCVQP